MKPLTLEWIDKAERDFQTMERVSRVRKNPNPDAVCFHAQQCVEKYLKARLCEEGECVPEIHDLNALLDRVLLFEPRWEAYREGFLYLSEYAVDFRNPGDIAEKDDALAAREYCRAFRQIVRMAMLPLSSE